MSRTNTKTILKMIEKANEVRRYSYAPYSGFAVGAALLCSDGTIYTGVNVENSSYPAGICAERTAFAKAISDNRMSFKAIAIVGERESVSAPSSECFPCGICRQFMSEFCDKDFEIITARGFDKFSVHTLGELLPFSFSLDE